MRRQGEGNLEECKRKRVMRGGTHCKRTRERSDGKPKAVCAVYLHVYYEVNQKVKLLHLVEMQQYVVCQTGRIQFVIT